MSRAPLSTTFTVSGDDRAQDLPAYHPHTDQLERAHHSQGNHHQKNTYNTGCGNTIPEMTEAEQELVVEYAASQLLKYHKGRNAHDQAYDHSVQRLHFTKII